MNQEQRQDIAAKLMPAIRGQISDSEPKLGHFDDSGTVLEFVCSADMPALATMGTSCPDRFLHTKICPLVVNFHPDNPDVVRAVLMDVTSELAVAKALQSRVLEYGGIDILVSNAGIASSAPVEETSLALWNQNMSILSTGYFWWRARLSD